MTSNVKQHGPPPLPDVLRMFLLRRMGGAFRPFSPLPPLAILCACLLLSGCEGNQSALATGGESADAISRLSWILFIGSAAIMALVIGLTFYAATASEERRRWAASNRFVIGGGIIFPVVTLSALLIYGLLLMGAVGRSAEAPAVRIEVTGEQYWWRVRYRDETGQTAVASANEIHLPVGAPVELILTTQDVIHSFWVPSLAGKLDMIPGQQNRMVLNATKPGVYRGQCAEYCGTQHAQMAFYAVAHPPGEFERWLAERRQPAAEPAGDAARTGMTLFMQAGCGACHAVSGTEAAGRIGPDLTHIGSRQSIGAGMYPNTAEMLAVWIKDNQHIKPGNKMPAFDALDEEQRRAIAAYLEGLK